MAALSILTSMLPTEFNLGPIRRPMGLSSYVPFFAMIYIARDKDDVVFILKIVCALRALFNTAAGIHRRIFFSNIDSSSIFFRRVC